ncbi:cyclic pyranopterin monophosphate synthase MoaC [Thalassobium sp. R2A62]|uniref:cyclic pyranopterin monophosphate synthase MoaC n=1 Tax=Thalassobium sp. R2A62 TaxID=633131 RepID=UPI0005949282|nr:cyclic pyranopterin monophosphate synthase MoaC [Thalassobium sp. R2A62]MDG1338573.1 cyclic pyranopterin monophosphate synthase MoaC [Paracoccaceae bacterium]
MSGLTHFDPSGHAHMVDVSGKLNTDRIATAQGWVKMTSETLEIITEGRAEKGDVLGIARLAGIMGAKQTSTLIPLCHPLPITKVSVELEPDTTLPGVRISATVKTSGQTGVEMEALTAVSTTALTLFDMVKAVEKTMEIGGIHVTLKDGGKSGRFEAP